MNIGVYGSAENTHDTPLRMRARHLGMVLAANGHTLITGGSPGLPYEAVLGAHALGGPTVAFSPAHNRADHELRYASPTAGFSEIRFLPETPSRPQSKGACYAYRNILSTHAVDAAVIINGGLGTLNEFVLLLQQEKAIGILKGSGGITDHVIPRILRSATALQASRVFYESAPDTLVRRLRSPQIPF